MSKILVDSEELHNLISRAYEVILFTLTAKNFPLKTGV